MRRGGRALARRSAAALALVLLLAACGKKEAPSGGPPDLDPPRLVETTPDSGAAGVPLDVRPTLTFSEGMEPRSTGDAVAFAPPVTIRQRRWTGRTLTLVPEQPLEANRTYTMFVGGTARDRHGNDYGTGATVVFSTAATFPPGAIAGTLDGRGFDPAGSYVWAYAEGNAPDSSARDFDGLGIADEDGDFEIVGLPAPGRYRLWVFADLNGNRSFEPRADILAAVDTTFGITEGGPRVAGFRLSVTNPRAPGAVAGTVLDSLPDSTGVLHVAAQSQADTTQRALVEVQRDGTWDLRFDAGTWWLRAFRDLNGDRIWQPERERASPRREVTVGPADRVTDVRLELRPAPGGD